MPLAGSELAILAIHRPQIYAADRPVTGTGTKKIVSVGTTKENGQF